MTTAPTIEQSIAQRVTADPPPETPGRFYCYVTEANRFCLLAGPFGTFGHAAESLWPALTAATRHDPWVHFYHHGIVNMKDTHTKPGRLNAELGLSTEDPCPLHATPARLPDPP